MDRVIDKASIGAIGLTFCLMPLLAVAGGLGLAPVAFILGLAGWSLLLRSGHARDFVKQPWLLALMALLLWCWITQFWSPYQVAKPLGNAAKLFIIVIGYCAIITAFQSLSPKLQNRFQNVFIIGAVIAVGITLIELSSGYKLSLLVDPVNANEALWRRKADSELNLGRGILTYVQFLPVLILMLAVKFKHGIWAGAALAIGFMIAAILNDLILPPIVMIACGFVMILAWRFPKMVTRTVLAGVILLVLLGPFTGLFAKMLSADTLLSVPLSLEHRFRMWSYCWDLIAENPLFGHGFDASRTYQDTFLARNGRDIVIVSLHPHNAAIQIWLETGAIGAGLAALTVALLIKPAVHFANTPIKASALCGTITAVILFGLTTIGVWQYWWIGSIFIGLGALTLCANPSMAHPQS